MRRRLHLAAALLAFATLAGCAADGGGRPATAPISAAPPPLTILISIDGFRADYLHKGHSPTLDALADGGLAGALRPSFPSKTFPNHYTLVTGKRPDAHGIVNNTMVDPRRPDVTFKLSDTRQTDDDFWWNAAEPIWVTAEKQGVRAATMFWPGSTAPIHGTRPSDWQAYAQAMPSAQRVRSVIDWLRRPALTRPRLVTVYFDEVDTAGHEEGPEGAGTAKAVAQVDAAIGQLRVGLQGLGLQANLVIVADHGMAAVSPERFADLNRLIAPGSYRLINSGPIAELAPLAGKSAAVEAAVLGRHDHFECWRKSALPERFHFGSNVRIPPIVCLADTGWEIGQEKLSWDARGDHGFDPDAPEMAALFIANGPAFAKPEVLPKLDNVDVYPLLARLIGIVPLANDGDAGTLAARVGR